MPAFSFPIIFIWKKKAGESNKVTDNNMKISIKINEQKVYLLLAKLRIPDPTGMHSYIVLEWLMIFGILVIQVKSVLKLQVDIRGTH